jgi:hypothetical protein
LGGRYGPEIENQLIVFDASDYGGCVGGFAQPLFEF